MLDRGDARPWFRGKRVSDAGVRVRPGRDARGSVYQHVLEWQEALNEVGMELSVWRIHRKVGMSGGLFANALLRETGREVTTREAERLSRLHTEAYARRIDQVRPLPGAVELLSLLTDLQVPWAIARSGGRATASRTIALLDVPDSTPVVTRDEVSRAKPDPDLFLAAAGRLNASPEDVVVVGDSVWDLLAARRARSLGVGLLSGRLRPRGARASGRLPRV